MSTLKEELKGTAEELVGKVKQVAGKLTDRPGLEAKGRAEEALGNARVEIAHATERVKGRVERAATAVLDGIGKLAAHTAAATEEKPASSRANKVLKPEDSDKTG